MRYRSREKRRNDSFDKKFDLFIVPLLQKNRFSETHPYFFTRETSNGRDVIYFDIEGKSMIVEIAYRPNELKEIDDLYYWYEPEPKGHSFVLTPNGFSKTDVFSGWDKTVEYPIKYAKDRDQSLVNICEGLQKHGFKRLDELKNPFKYCQYVDTDALMYVGRANEIICNFNEAKIAYEEVYRRFIHGVNLFKNVKQYITRCQKREPYVGRVGIYVTKKLGKNLEIGKQLSELINYNPKVSLLTDNSQIH